MEPGFAALPHPEDAGAATVITHVQAVEFVRLTGNGRTEPAILIVEDDDGNEIEVVAKLAAGCFEGVGSLACEAIASCLAADLGLRVPQPYFVHMLPGWVDTLLDTGWAAKVRAAPNVAFASRLISGGFSTWQARTSMSVPLTEMVARALAFDAGTENSDRSPANANCLQRGDEFYLIDHELCFPAHMIGRPKPWFVGGLQDLVGVGKQIFVDALRKKAVDWTPVIDSWNGLSDAMIDGYGQALPAQWVAGKPVVARAEAQIKAARDNIVGLVAEIERVLTC